VPDGQAGAFLGAGLAFAQHAPVRRDAFEHLDLHRLRLGVLELELEPRLIRVVVGSGPRELAEARLLAPGGDVEALPQPEVDGLALGGVGDAVPPTNWALPGIGNPTARLLWSGEPGIEGLGSARASASRRGATGGDTGSKPPFGTVPGGIWRGTITAGAGRGTSPARPGDGRWLPLYLLVEDVLGLRLGQSVPVEHDIDGRIFRPGKVPG